MNDIRYFMGFTYWLPCRNCEGRGHFRTWRRLWLKKACPVCQGRRGRRWVRDDEAAVS